MVKPRSTGLARRPVSTGVAPLNGLAVSSQLSVKLNTSPDAAGPW